jgi:hypothetical protein
MHRAWAIFRETYKYPQIGFADIGRKCFGWALRKAWAEAREAARVAAVPAEVRAERIETLQGLIARAGFIDSGPSGRQRFAATATKSDTGISVKLPENARFDGVCRSSAATQGWRQGRAGCFSREKPHELCQHCRPSQISQLSREA